MKTLHFGLLFLASLTLASCGGGDDGSGEDKNCSDFTYQQDAQAWHNANPGSNLDSDRDGLACEHLPRR